jgi:3',5'-cyclic AMP phosphodiesterase CpdA
LGGIHSLPSLPETLSEIYREAFLLFFLFIALEPISTGTISGLKEPWKLEKDGKHLAAMPDAREVRCGGRRQGPGDGPSEGDL